MIFSIILLVVLILINGVFSASELAFLSLDKVRLKREAAHGDKRALRMQKILADSSAFLSTIQIAITLAGFLASAFAADYFAAYLMGVIKISWLSDAVLRTLLVIGITVVLSYFTLVFGELVPKRIAMSRPDRVARLTSGLIAAVKVAFYPLVKLLTLSTEAVCKLLGVKENNTRMTEEDIKRMVLLGKDEGVIEEQEKEYILNIFEFNDVPAEQVMTPREQVAFVDADASLKEILKVIRATEFSRFPVYQGTEDNVIGALNVKDLLIRYGERRKIKVREMLRHVSKFQHDDKIDDVFRLMQERNESLGVVYKEGAVAGIVTIEDAVEEIVGNIYDEFD